MHSLISNIVRISLLSGAVLMLHGCGKNEVGQNGDMSNEVGTHGDMSAAAPPDLALSSSGSGSDGGSAPQRILFVGDSFTHGRYAPVRQYQSGGVVGDANGTPLVIDENFGQTGARAEVAPETGPWGGIPGIFARIAAEVGLPYEVHLEAISETSLENNYAVAKSVIAQPIWNAVVLQELSTRPLSSTLTMDTTSNPSNFCGSVQTIEAAVHAAAPAAEVYLYETWARADMAMQLAGAPTQANFAAAYAEDLVTISDAYHDIYYRAATLDGHIAAVAPVGEAWMLAWNAGVANPDPFVGTSTAPSLWYGLNATNDPMIKTADERHPSIYGAYLSALVLLRQIAGVDVTTLGGNELAAKDLGIASAIAVALQGAAATAVAQENTTVYASGDPCTVTK